MVPESFSNPFIYSFNEDLSILNVLRAIRIGMGGSIK